MSVGASSRREGWKIHLSSSPLALDELAARIVAVRKRERFPFKMIESLSAAMLLNEGGYGATQVGKCATLYPDDDAQFARLVELLAEIPDLGGPAVPSDARLGAALFVRHGGINPIIERDPLGQMRRLILGEDGAPVDDDYDRDATERRLHRDFAGDSLLRRFLPRAPLPARLSGGRYVVIDTLRTAPKGDLFQAFDLGDPVKPRPVILKQGRKGLLADRSGHDMRDRLRHQQRMHGLAARLGIAPECQPCFDWGEDRFLPIEFQPNDNFELAIQRQLGGRGIDGLAPTERDRLQLVLARIARQLAELHRIGIVHRDVSPSNILIDGEGRPLLSDLEIAYAVGDGGPIYGKGTPGFMAPEQEAGAAPAPEMDVHAFAALCLHAFTGIDPRRLPLPARSDRWRSLKGICRSVAEPVWELLIAGLDPDPRRRPPLAECEHVLAGAGGREKARRPGASKVRPTRALLEAGIATLSSPALLEPVSGLWLSPALDSAPGQVRFELRRSLNRGVAGPLYFCARAARHVALGAELRALCGRAAQWLIRDRDAPDHAMPGLHFGEAGVLLALHAARGAGLAAFDDAALAPLRAAVEADTDWLDITHGAAGIALALIELERSGAVASADAAARLDRLARQLSDAQLPEGHWVTPPGVPGMSGEVLTGFAHGVAGIAYALAVIGRHRACEEALGAAQRAADWLLGQAVADPRGGLQWAYGTRHPQPWIWWCHGAPGMAPLFAQLARATGRSRYRDAVPRCFARIPRRFSAANLSLCHGSAGLAQLMLDLAGEPGCAALAASAADMIANIAARHCRGARDVYWIVEEPDCVGADLMVGLAGLLHLLLRAETGDESLRFPALAPLDL